ncbi:GntR family transcriptional regulator [Herbaspirillum sp. SJZ099]|uniref:GntR family transcriptional regulator n=1 Tax=Herbaspirillum sp. SJZ099 TaxID=2572916 RepID=UPI0011A3C47B|nr:GntR family transcriptional regulator [Herbaspirillum sp. SJZ099]TWC65063.1 DNA-binding GntR family transcriptional regulator [Herbaspirillum sp. SJZ099]
MKPQRAPADNPETLDQNVYEAIFNAVMHGRLKPGTRLQEASLCEQFGVSRTVVRQALRRLAELRIVDIVPNKGAAVATPGPKETRDVFAARRAIESAIVREVARSIDHGDVTKLRQRMQAEHAALHEGDHPRWVALAGGFHLTLAELSGNQVLQRMLTELMTRCSLIVALYEVPGEASCEHDEHARLVDLLALRDGSGAAAEMDKHLLALEARLRLPQDNTEALRRAF